MNFKQQIFTWLKTQKYQVEDGEQEYKMYFELDIPTIIFEYIEILVKKYPNDQELGREIRKLIYK
jgi:hypothetical protein